jgi:hypothetical protein
MLVLVAAHNVALLLQSFVFEPFESGIPRFDVVGAWVLSGCGLV